MPIKSEQQRKFMAMCLHNPDKAQGKCPPKSVAKKFIHGHSRKDETLNMNNDIDPRLALKSLFEAALQNKLETLDEARVDELLGTLAGIARGGLRKAFRVGGKLKAAAQMGLSGGNPEGQNKARETYAKADQIKPDYMSGARWDAKQIGRVVTAPKAMADRFKRNIDSRRQDPDIDAMLDRRLSGARNTPNPTAQAQRPTASQAQRPETEFERTKRISAEAQAKNQQSGGNATISNNPEGGKILNIRQFRRGRVQASTDYARLGLRALFEAVLKENDEPYVPMSQRKNDAQSLGLPPGKKTPKEVKKWAGKKQAKRIAKARAGEPPVK